MLHLDPRITRTAIRIPFPYARRPGTARLHVAVCLGLFEAAPVVDCRIGNIARQTHRDWSLHIRDDCSHDAGADRALEAAERLAVRKIRVTRGGHRGPVGNPLSIICALGQDAGAAALATPGGLWHPGLLTTAVEALSGSGSRPAVWCARRAGSLRPTPAATGWVGYLAGPGCGLDALVLNRPAIALVRTYARLRLLPALDRWIPALVAGCGGRVMHGTLPMVSTPVARQRAWRLGLRALAMAGHQLNPEVRALVDSLTGLRVRPRAQRLAALLTGAVPGLSARERLWLARRL